MPPCANNENSTSLVKGNPYKSVSSRILPFQQKVGYNGFHTCKHCLKSRCTEKQMLSIARAASSREDSSRARYEKTNPKP